MSKAPITVWFPDGWMENHRVQEHTDALLEALAAEKVQCVTDDDPRTVAARSCDLGFIGSWKFYPAGVAYRAENPGKPLVHYNWDLYPFQLNERTNPRTDRTGRARPTPNACRWAEYVAELKHAIEVWVPSEGVVLRTREFAGRASRVVLCNYFGWDVPDREPPFHAGTYVVDVMREYTGEPMVGAVRESCQALGVPCVQTNHGLPWDVFQVTVAGAGLLVSAYNEASTGGLTLLEGYAHGVPVLVSDSPYQGANDYFPEDQPNFWTFKAGDKEDLKVMVEYCVRQMRQRHDSRSWVEREYGVAAFARRLADGFRRVLGG